MKHEEILSLRASGHVCRWHTIRTLMRQTVAEHCGQAITLLLMLHPAPSMDLVKAVAWHDSAERVVGDAPSPGLRASPEYKYAYEQAEMKFMLESHGDAHAAISNLTPDERRWLRAIDLLEAYLQAYDEIKLGNRDFEIVVDRLSVMLVNDDTPIEIRTFHEWFVVDGHARSFA